MMSAAVETRGTNLRRGDTVVRERELGIRVAPGANEAESKEEGASA